MNNVASMLNTLNLVQSNNNLTALGKSSIKGNQNSDFQEILNKQIDEDDEEVIEELVVPIFWQNTPIPNTNGEFNLQDNAIEFENTIIKPVEEFIQDEVINKLIDIGISEEVIEQTMEEMKISNLDLFNEGIFDEFATKLTEHMLNDIGEEGVSEIDPLLIKDFTAEDLKLETEKVWKEISNQKEIILAAKNVNNEPLINDDISYTEKTKELNMDMDLDVKLASDVESDLEVGENLLNSEELPSMLDVTEITQPIINSMRSDLPEKENELSYFDRVNEFRSEQEQKQLSMSIYKQIIEKIEISKFMEKQEVTMQLHPKELGKMSIKIIGENGKYIANVKLDNQKTKDLVMENIAELKNNLEEQGLVIEQFSIDINKEDKNSLMEQGRKKSSKRINDIISSILDKLDEEREQVSNQLEVDVTV